MRLLVDQVRGVPAHLLRPDPEVVVGEVLRLRDQRPPLVVGAGQLGTAGPVHLDLEAVRHGRARTDCPRVLGEVAVDVGLLAGAAAPELLAVQDQLVDLVVEGVVCGLHVRLEVGAVDQHEDRVATIDLGPGAGVVGGTEVLLERVRLVDVRLDLGLEPVGDPVVDVVHLGALSGRLRDRQLPERHGLSSGDVDVGLGPRRVLGRGRRRNRLVRAHPGTLQVAGGESVLALAGSHGRQAGVGLAQDRGELLGLDEQRLRGVVAAGHDQGLAADHGRGGLVRDAERRPQEVPAGRGVEERECLVRQADRRRQCGGIDQVGAAAGLEGVRLEQRSERETGRTLGERCPGELLCLLGRRGKTRGVDHRKTARGEPLELASDALERRGQRVRLHRVGGLAEDLEVLQRGLLTLRPPVGLGERLERHVRAAELLLDLQGVAAAVQLPASLVSFTVPRSSAQASTV